MHMNLRRYPRIAAGKEAVERSVEAELLPDLRKEPGFKGYCAFWDEEGAGVSVSLFDGRDAAHRSTDAARRWVMRHQDFFPGRGEEFAGECFVHEAPRAAGAGPTPSLHVLVRELVGVPPTQDAQAFVHQRTLPMITRSPGFVGVYMARNDREHGRAAVVTVFDGEERAVACHRSAVELLAEGLPGVRVARVVHGRCVVFALEG